MFNINDLVTGKNRSYKRSIYRYIGPHEDSPETMGYYQFVTLGNTTVKQWKDRGADPKQYTFPRDHDEFRLATPEEIEESDNVVTEYAVRSLLHKLKVISLDY